MPVTGDLFPFQVFSREQILSALNRAIKRIEAEVNDEMALGAAIRVSGSLAALNRFREELEKEP